MAQDLRKISYESFIIQLHKIPSKQLLDITRQIKELMAEYGNTLSISEGEDLIRKETSVQRELIMRKWYKKKDHHDWNVWYNKMGHHKKVW